MQLVHLLLADVLFVALVRITAASLETSPAEATVALPERAPTA
jgi:hypothetical protein